MPIPDETRDRWSSRAEPDSGTGAIYWHMLFRDNPAACAAARKARVSELNRGAARTATAAGAA